MNRFRKYGPTLPLLATALLLCSCGIKPGSLEPPSGADKDDFPHTYPAPDQR